MVQAVTQKFNYPGRNKKKLDWISGEAILSETEGWILASKLNCSRFVLPYPTTFIIQRAKPFCGYVYGVRFSPHYMYWTDQDGRSKPLVKQRGRWSNQPVKILSIWKNIFTIKKVLLHFVNGFSLTYFDVVAVRPVPVSSIRKWGIILDFSLGFGVFISCVTHGPPSIVWRHITVSLECIWMTSSIRNKPVHTISRGVALSSNIITVICWKIYVAHYV